MAISITAHDALQAAILSHAEGERDITLARDFSRAAIQAFIQFSYEQTYQVKEYIDTSLPRRNLRDWIQIRRREGRPTGQIPGEPSFAAKGILDRSAFRRAGQGYVRDDEGMLQTVSGLPPNPLARFGRWLAEYDVAYRNSGRWDELDPLIRRRLTELEETRCRWSFHPRPEEKMACGQFSNRVPNFQTNAGMEPQYLNDRARVYLEGGMTARYCPDFRLLNKRYPLDCGTSP